MDNNFDNNIQCFHNFYNVDKLYKLSNQIVVLGPNCEFLLWNLTVNNRRTSRQKNSSKLVPRWRPLQLFKDDYLEAACRARKKSIKLNEIKTEIAKAWTNANIEVHFKYIELAYLHNSMYNLRINCLMDFHLPQPTILNHNVIFSFKYSRIRSINVFNQFTHFPKNVIHKNSTKKVKVTITLKKSEQNKTGQTVCYIRIHYESN